ncbi:4-hydroxy-tetrahydrodipicolinate synthase [archaeon SCG-AAA382B04]|nr:4-hydroxy-tetrahydrodipicolinate synthase [archaeon SCG-AAA382B04]
MKLEGVFPAIITPFKENQELDEEGLRNNIDFLIKNNVSGIVPNGTTGESATLSYEEHKRVTEVVVDHVDNRVPVVAGTGSNSTREAIELTKHAEEAGVDCAMVITPYYNKPTDRGLIKHYKKIADSTELPILMYNVPSRTGTNMEPHVISELSKVSNIIGVKEASGDINQVSRILEETLDDFNVLSGDDGLTFELMSLGGNGVVSVAANIAPGLVSEMVSYLNNGELEKARNLHYNLSPLFRDLFLETNPIPVKTAARMLDLPSGPFRSPMADMSKENRKKLKETLKKVGFL